MGPSGCGKSTLLNLIGLLDVPDSGSYRFLDQEITTQSKAKKTKLRKNHIGFVFQSFNLIDDLTVLENVALPLKYQGSPLSLRRSKAKALIERLGVDHRMDHYPQQLSGGQQQRVAIARALVTDPILVLADEATGNLDSAHGDEIINILSELNAQGITIVMVTHSEHDANYAHRIVHMLDGQIVGEQLLSPGELS